jgi:type II secretory pathway component PulF
LLVHSTDILAEMFKGLGVQLSYATKVLISNYTWIYPLLFGGAAASLIANEILVRDTSRRLQTSRALFAADQRFRRSGDYCFVFALAQFD